MSWLINSMTNETNEDFMFYETAKEIWDAAKEMLQTRIIPQSCLKLKDFLTI